MTKLYSRQAENAVKMMVKGNCLKDRTSLSYGSCALHSLLLQQTHTPNFKAISHEMSN